MTQFSLISSGALFAVVAIGLLRLSWSRPIRSVTLNGAAWGLMLLGMILGGTAYGAWGVTIVILAATIAALLALSQAAAADRHRSRRAPSRRPTRPAGVPRRIGRRLVTFLLTVPVALAVALLICVGLANLADFAEVSAADGPMIALMLLPLIWAILLVALLMATRRRSQGLILVVPAVVGGLTLLIGGA